MNERGFVFPVTLCVLMLFSLFFATQLDKLTIERKFSHEVETFKRNQFLLLKALKVAEEEILLGNVEGGELLFSDVRVTYSILEEGESVLRIEFLLESADGRTAEAWAWFDLESMATIKWLERN